MKQIEKDIHLTLALVREINRRGLADLSIDFGRAGSVPVTITRWSGNLISGTWNAFEHDLSGDLSKIRRDLAKIMAEAKAEKREMAA